MAAPDRGEAALLEFLRQTSNVFLSPHYDDVCFSLGITVREIGRGTILNLFTRTRHVVNPAMKTERQWALEEATAQRDAEDGQFAAATGLLRDALGLDEPGVRGRRHRDLAGTEEDCAQLAAPLTTWLAEMAAKTPAPRALFCPAGIGRHVNHRATVLTIVRMLPRLERAFRVFFYEDLPYASFVWRRLDGLIRLRRLTAGRRIRRHAVVLGERRTAKLDLVRIYVSQHDRDPTPRRFSPAAVWPLSAHEAFWELLPQGG